MAKRLQVPKKSQVNRNDSVDNLVWKQRLRAYALKPLLPSPAMPNKAELSRMFIQEGGRFLQMMKPNTVRVWMYNRKTLTGLLYHLLFRYTDYEKDCFTAAMDQFSVYSDAELLASKFTYKDYKIPEERLCVIQLGTAARNAYLTEILNEIVRHRLKRVDRSRTIFLFEGTRTDFQLMFGKVGECTLDRDEYVIDWNSDAERCTNRANHISEDIISRTVPASIQHNSTTPVAPKTVFEETVKPKLKSKTYTKPPKSRPEGVDVDYGQFNADPEEFF